MMKAPYPLPDRNSSSPDGQRKGVDKVPQVSKSACCLAVPPYKPGAKLRKPIAILSVFNIFTGCNGVYPPKRLN